LGLAIEQWGKLITRPYQKRGAVWPPLPDEAPEGWPNCDTPVINSRVIPTNPIR